MAVLYTKSQIERIHKTKTAEYKKVYVRDDGELFIGNVEGYVERSKELIGDTKGKTLDNTFSTLGTFVFKQGVADTTWVIPHPLNKYPSVTIVDSMGTVIRGQIVYVTKSLINANFNAPFSGTATLN